MGDFSDFARNAACNHALGISEWAFTPGVWLALFNGPNLSDEVVVSGYSRQSVTMSPATTPAGVSANLNVVLFGPLLAPDEVTHVAIFDSSSGGDAVTVIKALGTPRPWDAGDSVQFGIGEVDFAVT